METIWKFSHVGAVVEDADRAIKHFEGLGIGPFKLHQKRPSLDRFLYGKPVLDVKTAAWSAPLGPIEFELIQPICGESLQREFLRRHGEGINHIAFFVDDLDKEVTELTKKGFKVVSSGRRADVTTVVYLDTDKVGGVQIELLQA